MNEYNVVFWSNLNHSFVNHCPTFMWEDEIILPNHLTHISFFLFVSWLSVSFFSYLTYLFYFSFYFLSQGMFLSVSSVSLSNRISKRWCKMVAICMMSWRRDSPVAGAAHKTQMKKTTSSTWPHLYCQHSQHNQKKCLWMFLGDTKKWLQTFVTLKVTESGCS